MNEIDVEFQLWCGWLVFYFGYVLFIWNLWFFNLVHSKFVNKWFNSNIHDISLIFGTILSLKHFIGLHPDRRIKHETNSFLTFSSFIYFEYSMIYRFLGIFNIWWLAYVMWNNMNYENPIIKNVSLSWIDTVLQFNPITHYKLKSTSSKIKQRVYRLIYDSFW